MDRLTVKERKFISGILAGKTQKEAAGIAGLNENYAGALLKTEKVQTAFQAILDEAGLTDKALAEKLRSLIDAKETRFFQKDGKVIETREVEAIETQRKTTEFVAKLKGHLIERVEHSSEDGIMAAVVLALQEQTIRALNNQDCDNE
jgi:hypothetical protein